MYSTRSCVAALIAGVLCLAAASAQVGPLPAGDSGSSTCRFNIQGKGGSASLKFKLAYASITCTTSNPRYKKAGAVVFYAGAPLVAYAKAHPTQFKGVRLRPPNEPNFLGTGNRETSFFLVGNGKLKLTGQVKNLSNQDWPAITIETGTQAEFNGMLFEGNRGEKFGAVAISRSQTLVTGCRFAGNICDIKGKCHAPALYVTEGARFTVMSSTFYKNVGHQGGALMITSGALGTVVGNTFQSNSVTAYGSPGGAIFHDFCTTPRAQGKQSTITKNRFLSNYANGFGGALKIGSPNGGCKPTVSANTFSGNKAALTGGAIFYTYCNNGTPNVGSSNTFSSNTANTFNGQLGYNSQGKGQTGVKTAAICKKPTVASSNKFSSSPARYSAQWYFG